MVQLHFNGIIYDLDEDQSVADVFNLLNNYTQAQNGSTWLRLADGGSVHIQVDGPPTFAVVAPKGYKPEGLKVTNSGGPGGGADEPVDQHAELMDLLDRRLGDMQTTLEGIEAAVNNME
ncbi:hypothetical protein [Mycobacterium riyadhense]|uniref:hypothetical protein n=1 Tax=Mycobacterium riyadhense TaxID=486698 RepID=UPI001959D1EA|nr:hypothetical protein [Mycobacterium riyadhense]